MKLKSLYLLVLVSWLFSCRQAPPASAPEETKQSLPPVERYGELFIDVQMAQVFPDGKTFADCTPKFTTDEILERYAAQKDSPGFELAAFVEEHFERPEQYASGFQSDTSRSIAEHINALWPVLTRSPDAVTQGALIALPYPYIVPGGRFGEIYYWDSYFTMLGLQAAGKTEMIENMINNFAYLIDTVGFIPNGNRTYFLSRSQPPFFALMVKLLAEEKGGQVLTTYLPQLEKEYAFWMAGRAEVSEATPAVRKVVRLPNGDILNRYWDRRRDPRAEMYHDDVVTAQESDRPAEELYSDIRAACESGWDFSSRWFADAQNLTSIHTTEIIPVDLNALLYALERTIASAYAAQGNTEQQQAYEELAGQRRDAILKWCWDENAGFFVDYDFVRRQPTGVLSLAGAFPLALQIAEPEQARKAAGVIGEKFLQPGGVVSTLNNTGQQWDAPNGWAPLQWMTIQGLRNYNQQELADEIKRRWIALNVKVYQHTGKMVEKYDVMDMSLEAGGGEYPVQDGFGWSNGVLLKLLREGEPVKD